MAQSYQDWEWIIALNGGNKWSPPVADPRIKIVVADSSVTGVGAAKREACSRATGEFLIERDHDDILGTDAIEEIVRAFDENPSVGLVFSHFAQIN